MTGSVYLQSFSLTGFCSRTPGPTPFSSMNSFEGTADRQLNCRDILGTAMPSMTLLFILIDSAGKPISLIGRKADVGMLKHLIDGVRGEHPMIMEVGDTNQWLGKIIQHVHRHIGDPYQECASTCSSQLALN